MTPALLSLPRLGHRPELGDTRIATLVRTGRPCVPSRSVPTEFLLRKLEFHQDCSGTHCFTQPAQASVTTAKDGASAKREAALEGATGALRLRAEQASDLRPRLIWLDGQRRQALSVQPPACVLKILRSTSTSSYGKENVRA